MDNKGKYIPDLLTAPGDVIKVHLDSLKLTQDDFVTEAGLSKEIVTGIINGDLPITQDIASRLEKVLGGPVHFWLAMEQLYQEDKRKLAEQEQREMILDDTPTKILLKTLWARAFA